MSDIAYAPPFNPKTALRDLGIDKPGSIFAIDASDFDAAAKAIFELSEYVGSTTALLLEVKAIAQHDMRDHFEQEEAPNGQKWADLSPKYAKEKVADGHSEHPYLVREGDMKKAALSEEAWTVAGDSVLWDSSVMPYSKGKDSMQYWSVHQYGHKSMKGHDRLPQHDKNGHVLGYRAVSNDPGGRAGVPARPFVGLSDKAGEEIIALFDTWIDSGMTGDVLLFEKYQRIGQRYKGATITGVGKGAGGRLQYRTTRGFGPMV